jgi:hypothetical protein
MSKRWCECPSACSSQQAWVYNVLAHCRSLLSQRNVRRIVGVELDLINSRRSLEAGIGHQLLKVLDGEVGNTNVLHTSGLGKLLELSPCVEEVPVWQVLLEVFGVGR